MATFKKKSTEEVQAMQFTGNNVKTIQGFVGDRYPDRKKLYALPRFDLAENWQEVVDMNAPALLWDDRFDRWATVAIDDWVVKTETGYTVMTDAELNAEYEAATDA